MKSFKKNSWFNNLYPAGLICLTTFFLFADQNLMSPNLTLIAREFGFSDLERDEKLGGEIALGFFLIGGVISIIAGYLTDTSNRVQLYFYTVLLGEISCIYAYYSKTYEQLYYSRVLTGISIGGAAPIIYSLLADYYPSSIRIHVAMIVSISMNLGASSGQLLAGYIAPQYGWRLPFLLIALPAILSATLMLFTVTEPIRGANDYTQLDDDDDDDIEIHTTKNDPIDCKLFQRMLRQPTIVLALLQGIPGCIPWGVIGVYLNDYISYDIGFSTKEATYVLTCLGFGIIGGQMIGGTVGQLLYNKNPSLQCIFMGSSTCLGALPMLFVVNIKVIPKFLYGVEDWSSKEMMYYSILMASLLTGLIAAITGPNVRSVLQNVSTPKLRGTIFSLFNLTDDLGKGGGPYLLAKLTEYFGSRRISFSLGVSCWFICGFLLLLMSFTVKYDEMAVRLELLNKNKEKGKTSGDEFDGFTQESISLLKHSP